MCSAASIIAFFSTGVIFVGQHINISGLVNNLLDVVKMTDTWIPFIIMTSEKNNKDTVEFFKEHNYFGYNSEYVRFFIQDMAPSVDFNGKIYMEDKDRISSSPNGNGGWFSSLVRSGIFDELCGMGVEWLNVFAVDNVLQRIADPCFIGAVIETGSESGSKVVSKAAPEEKVGVMCLEDGKPSIVEYYELTDEMTYQRLENGQLACQLKNSNAAAAFDNIAGRLDGRFVPLFHGFCGMKTKRQIRRLLG